MSSGTWYRQKVPLSVPCEESTRPRQHHSECKNTHKNDRNMLLPVSVSRSLSVPYRYTDSPAKKATFVLTWFDSDIAVILRRATMGIEGFLRQVKDALEESHLRKYSGQAIVVDAFSWLHKACVCCASVARTPCDSLLRLEEVGSSRGVCCSDADASCVCLCTCLQMLWMRVRACDGERHRRVRSVYAAQSGPDARLRGERSDPRV